MENPMKNISVSTIITVVIFLSSIVGGIWNMSKMYSQMENNDKKHEMEIKELRDYYEKQIDELKKKVTILEAENSDIEERVDDSEEFRAYMEGKMSVERTR